MREENMEYIESKKRGEWEMTKRRERDSLTCFAA